MENSQLIRLLNMDYFELLGCPSSFNINQNQLRQSFLNLQKQYHPDSFVNQNDEQKNLSLLLSGHINSAYTSLSSPLLRAIALLKFRGIDFDLTKNTSLPSEFLMEQMEIHEIIEDAVTEKDLDALENIELRLNVQEKAVINQLELIFDQEEITEATELVKQLAFYNKLIKSVSENIRHIL